MELDSRIIEGKRPLDCVDSETAKEFIGENGYFANCIQAFQDLESTDYQLAYATLKEVDSQRVIAFTDDFDGEYSYFLPEEWVKEPEKKYRPFTLAEWIGQHAIGDVIRYRCKSQKIELRHLYAGYGYGIGTDIKNTTSGTLTLGVASYTMDYLLEDYEIEVNGEWLPFGVVDEGE